MRERKYLFDVIVSERILFKLNVASATVSTCHAKILVLSPPLTCMELISTYHLSGTIIIFGYLLPRRIWRRLRELICFQHLGLYTILRIHHLLLELLLLLELVIPHFSAGALFVFAFWLCDLHRRLVIKFRKNSKKKYFQKNDPLHKEQGKVRFLAALQILRDFRVM